MMTTPFDRYVKQVAERAEQQDREGRWDHANLREAREIGLTSLNLPRAQGGADADLPQLVEAVRKLGKADPATALIMTMHFFHVEVVKQSTTWPEPIKNAVFASIAEHGELINALRVEPEQGSPVRGGRPSTLAVRHEDGWRMNGHKLYSTGSTALGWGIVWAATDLQGAELGEFLVPMNSPGITISPTWNHMGLRGSDSHDVHFNDVWLPAHSAVDIRPPAQWGAREGNLAGWLPILLAALYDGLASAAVDWVTQWLNTREPSNLGAPLATLPRMRSAVGEIAAWAQTNEAMLSQAAQHYAMRVETTEGGPARLGAGIVKQVVTQNAMNIVAKAVELSGNHALQRANPLERYLRDVHCARIHHPQNDLILEAAGAQLLNRNLKGTRP